MSVQDSVKAKRAGQAIHIDMTPMVDLGFLLITFFILTTTMSQPNAIDMKLPAKPKNPQAQVDRPEIDLSNAITVLLGKDDKIYYHQLDEQLLTSPDKLNVTTFDKDGIEKVIDDARRRAKKPDIFTVIIKPTDDSTYNDFVNMLDEMEILNIEHYGITEVKPWEKAIYEQKVGTSTSAGTSDSAN